MHRSRCRRHRIFLAITWLGWARIVWQRQWKIKHDEMEGGAAARLLTVIVQVMWVFPTHLPGKNVSKPRIFIECFSSVVRFSADNKTKPAHFPDALPLFLLRFVFAIFIEPLALIVNSHFGTTAKQMGMICVLFFPQIFSLSFHLATRWRSARLLLVEAPDDDDNDDDDVDREQSHRRKFSKRNKLAMILFLLFENLTKINYCFARTNFTRSVMQRKGDSMEIRMKIATTNGKSMTMPSVLRRYQARFARKRPKWRLEKKSYSKNSRNRIKNKNSHSESANRSPKMKNVRKYFEANERKQKKKKSKKVRTSLFHAISSFYRSCAPSDRGDLKFEPVAISAIIRLFEWLLRNSSAVERHLTVWSMGFIDRSAIRWAWRRMTRVDGCHRGSSGGSFAKNHGQFVKICDRPTVRSNRNQKTN